MSWLTTTSYKINYLSVFKYKSKGFWIRFNQQPLIKNSLFIRHDLFSTTYTNFKSFFRFYFLSHFSLVTAVIVVTLLCVCVFVFLWDLYMLAILIDKFPILLHVKFLIYTCDRTWGLSCEMFCQTAMEFLRDIQFKSNLLLFFWSAISTCKICKTFKQLKVKRQEVLQKWNTLVTQI